MPVDARFSRPSCRVIRCGLDQLEREIRRRDWYDLAHVTQVGHEYTLFFVLKPVAPAVGEHVIVENAR